MKLSTSPINRAQGLGEEGGGSATCSFLSCALSLSLSPLMLGKPIATSNILWSFYFSGLPEGFTSLCSFISLLTPMRLEVFHVKTSLLLSKNKSNSASLLANKSWEISTTLSDSLGSNGTHLVSHSCSIGLLVKLSSFLLLASPL
jgi:hypothetical protein